MADVHDKATRSYNMSRIKGRNTKPELLVRKYLHNNGFRYRLYNRNLPGKPDLTLPKYQTVIFVNGCFWHGHKGCRYFVLPETRKIWWQDKIEETIKRDFRTTKKLNDLGWNAIVIWECGLKSDKRESTLSILHDRLIKAEKLSHAE